MQFNWEWWGGVFCSSSMLLTAAWVGVVKVCIICATAGGQGLGFVGGVEGDSHIWWEWCYEWQVSEVDSERVHCSLGKGDRVYWWLLGSR